MLRRIEERMRTSGGGRPRKAWSGVGLAVVLVATGCTSGDGETPTTPPEPQATTIPQPIAPPGLPLAPDADRVDLGLPTFSDPTNITNPLFPVSRQGSVLLVGRVDGEPFRTEVTLLPETRIIEWEGRRVETLISQYAAFLDGRIAEIAYDFYAQADDGSVWYLGEDVFDFRDGAIIGTEGTWLAGREGPAAMIMPADPQVGDVYRPENSPPVVFEEVTVTSVSETLDGPTGSIEGGLIGSELHMDGVMEDKIFAPGYGEFYTSDGSDIEALALAVPTDAASGPVPDPLTTLSSGSLDVFEAAGAGNWGAAPATMSELASAWDTYRAGDVPRLIEPRLDRALQTLVSAVDARAAARARSAAIETARLSFDLQLRYRPVVEVDLARLDLWAAQLLVDEAAGDTDGVTADSYAMDYVRDRILGAVDNGTLNRINTELGAIQAAVVDEEPAAAADAAGRLRETLAELSR